MTRLLLIRHGESEANHFGYFAGQFDAPLIEKGITQAKITAEFIRKNYEVTRVYASDLSRALVTGKAVAELFGVDVITDERLREIYAGSWQKMSFSDIERDFSGDFCCWRNDIGNCTPTNGESVRTLGKRVMDVLSDIAKLHDGETVAVATHATAIRAAQCVISGVGFDSMHEIPWITNASVTEITVTDGNFKIVKSGMDEHLAMFKTSFPANV